MSWKKVPQHDHPWFPILLSMLGLFLMAPACSDGSPGVGTARIRIATDPCDS
jgi:hypothetical protein